MRTAAIQCCQGQDCIDKVIPIYWDDTSIKDPLDRMSLLMISDKARQSSSKEAVYTINANNRHIKCATGLPSVAILLDMGLEHTEVEARYDRSLQRCWRIYASGMTRTTFPFLRPYPEVATMLGQIVRRAHEPEMKTPASRALRAKMELGASSLDEDMAWWDPGAPTK